MAAARTNQNDVVFPSYLQFCSHNELILSLMTNNAIAIWLAHSSCGLVFRLLLPRRHGQTEEQPRGGWQRREGWREEDQRSTHYRWVWKASSKASRSCAAVSGVVVASQNDRSIHVVASAVLAKLDSLWVLTSRLNIHSSRILDRPRSGALAKHDTIETYFDNVLGTKEVYVLALSKFGRFFKRFCWT